MVLKKTHINGIDVSPFGSDINGWDGWLDRWLDESDSVAGDGEETILPIYDTPPKPPLYAYISLDTKFKEHLYIK